MEEKNSGFSLNRRLLRALRRRARGEGGVTLVEMMVSLFIFAIVSTMFTVSSYNICIPPQPMLSAPDRLRK